jgi:PAS domain S-box-containing protein
MDPHADSIEDNRRLRRTMRDLVALSTLPAIWIGMGAEGIARSLADVLHNTLSLDFIYIRLAGHGSNDAVEVVRRKNSTGARADVEVVRESLATLLTGDPADTPLTIQNPFSNETLRVAATRFGVGDDQGVLISGSSRPDFPTEQDRLLLGVGANQTAIVLQRRRAEGQVHEHREWLRVTLASIGDAVIATDTLGRITFLNAIAERLTGWASSEAEGESLEKVFVILNEQSRQPVQNPVERVLREGVVVGLATHTILIARDGTEHPIDDSAAPIRDAAGKMLGVVMIFREVSEQRRIEEQRNVRLAVTHALSEAATVTQGIGAVLHAVCENLRWDIGLFWRVSEAGTALECTNNWHRPDKLLDEFETISCIRTFRPGEGLPGRVWASGAPASILDITKDSNFPRICRGVTFELRSAMAHPVTVGDRTLGVIEFFTRRFRELDANLSEMMGTIAGSIGQFIERKKAEDNLRQSEQELADFFENATVGLHWVGPDGIVLRVNQAELDMLGYRREEYVGRPIAEFHADEEVICDILKKLQAGQKLAEYPARLRCKDGSIKEVLIDSSVLWRDGQFVHTRCFTRDVTERKRAQAKLREQEKRAEIAIRESEQRFRQLADAMPQIVWTAGPDGNIDYLNHRWTEFSGLPQTVGNAGWASLLHPDDAGPAGKRWADSVATGAPFEMEVRLRDRHKEIYRWHLIRTVAVRDEKMNIARWFGTSTDIHEQKRSMESARYLAEASAALAGVVDYESTLQRVANLAVPYFADWSAVDVADGEKLRRLAVSHQNAKKIQIAHELFSLYPPDLKAQGGVGAVFRTGKPEILGDITDDLIVHGARDERHLRLIRSLGLKSYICVPLIVSGNTLGVLTFATAESGRQYTDADLALASDLANRAAVAIENTRLYQALREADRRKDEFLATLAHELRNPLAPVRNALEMLKRVNGDPALADDARSMMERQVAHMSRLIDDLMDVSRITRGKLALRREKLDVCAAARQAADVCRRTYAEKCHDMRVTLPPEPLYVFGDPVRLEQIIGNLLNNACKYTDRGGVIELRAAREGNQVVLSVKDNGIGISQSMLPKVFDMFTQADHSAERAGGGLGIGLSLVRGLVELHGGSVVASSEGEGRGSEFTVRLPALVQARQSEKPQVQLGIGPTAGAGRRILVVDDNKDSAKSLSMLLKLQGNQTQTAHDGEEAVQRAVEFAPDVVLLDIGLPKLDGYDACRAIRKQRLGNQPIIIALTGWGQEDDRRKSREAGFDSHLIKPVDYEALLAMIESLSPALKID